MTNTPRWTKKDVSTDTLAAQVMATDMAVISLILTHPNKEALKKNFESLSRPILNNLLTKMTPDEFIADVHAYVDGLLEFMSDEKAGAGEKPA
jgi:hypothetical protein